MCDAPHENHPWVMREACLTKVLPTYLPTYPILPYQAGQVIRSYLVNVTRKWRRKMILITRGVFQKVSGAYKRAQFKENAPEVDSEFF